jgi:sigma-E factor negative regulatory protein RseA
MSEQLRESVSAVMDGEANELELRRVLAQDNADIVRGTWSRYHTVKDTFHSSDHELSFKGWDISQKVSDAIADEQVALPNQPRRSSWVRPAAGLAVAASVAFAMVIGVQSLQPVSTESAPAVIASQQTAPPSRVYPLQSSSPTAQGNMRVGAKFAAQSNLPGTSAVSKAAADMEAQKRLDKYILRHTERASLNNGKGMISFARVASFEAQ